ncbi:MAG: aminopeptidase, partial [Desulfuromonas sp.]
VVAACSDFGYYSQGIGGHLSMMAKRQSIEKIVVDPSNPERLRHELQLVLDIRSFAETDLAMPVGESFSTYADIRRSYAVWNVVAAPAYSLAPKEWCFPFTGCLPYRGYFSRDRAELFADSLRQRGLDVYTYGVPAYSTLGWFNDPVLNTFVDYPEWALAGLIFHEMAHQMVYAESDGDFNEAFASAVEGEGVKRWLNDNRSLEEQKEYALFQQRQGDFLDLVASTREELLDCFDGRMNGSSAEREECKQHAFSGMRKAHRELKQEWGGYSGYDDWFAGGLNNARFLSSHTYRFHLDAFAELLRRNGNDLPAFYRAAQRLAALPSVERQVALADLRKAFVAAIPDASTPAHHSGSDQSAKSGI